MKRNYKQFVCILTSELKPIMSIIKKNKIAQTVGAGI